ncbi:MAG: META domain-containing protein, partial [Anaerolineales bacterium]|nr:META domain-containing protein [Anaerolineales bacterium]
FTAADNQLSLSNGEEVLATFEADTGDTATGETPEAGGDLAGTNWVLGTLNDELRISGTSPFLQFATDGTVSGSDGCNQFSTTYVQDGSNLTIEQPAASTMMACEEPVMAQATAFMTALADTTNFAMTEYDLALLNGEQILATFIVNSSDLADTAWEVVNYNNGRDAVVSLVLGTEISANFGVEGDLTGNAGCNQYFTTFTASDGSIEIGTIGSSMRFCSEPPGVMEQEAEYLAALESAVTYSLQGDMLQMRTAEDQLAVVMTRKLMVDLPEPEPAVPTGRITGAPQGVNVRSGPGVNFPIIGLAQNGDEGEIVGRSADNRWWAAAVPSAQDGIGWVSADFVIAINASDVPVIEVAPPIIIVPTAAPTPTPIPAPTATPTPQISFTADQTSIQQGQCTTLRWSVENIQAVWVYPQGERFDRFPRTGQGSEQVCPTSTTTYEMRVLLRDGSTVIRQVTVNVTGATPDPLAGTRWDVVNFNNGQGGLVTLLQNTHMTMVFSADGQLTGSASCNNYFASYQVNGSNITISPPGSSQRICDVPEGIMEQEAQFLAILPSVATFQINGSILEMRTAGGQGAVVANRIP